LLAWLPLSLDGGKMRVSFVEIEVFSVEIGSFRRGTA
jgi:hypothetical protein